MKVLAEQSAIHGTEAGIAQVFAVLVLVMPSLFAFLASLAFHGPWASAPGLWFFWEVSLNVGYGAIPIAVGLTTLAVYGRESSIRSLVAMAVVSTVGIALTWYARRP